MGEVAHIVVQGLCAPSCSGVRLSHTRRDQYPAEARLSLSSSIRGRRSIALRAAAEPGAEPSVNSSCCGGSGSDSCGDAKPRVAATGVGKEFEALVAAKMMMEFEENYVKGELQGTISRDVIEEVQNEVPELLERTTEERTLDVDELLREGREMARGTDFVFDLDDMIV